MPLVVNATQPEAPEADPEFDPATLIGEDGQPTAEATTVATFLETVDWTPLFDDPDVRPFVVTADEPFVEAEDGRLVPVAEAAEGEDPVEPEGLLTVETIDGAVAAEFIDEDDLLSLFGYYLAEEHPDESLADRLILGKFADVVEAGAALIGERKAPFKKGDFRKGPMGGVAKGKVHNQRVRMMTAMIKKGAIKRVKKGTGYKGGDYTKDKGYGGGTKGGKSAYKAASSGNSGRAGAIGKMVDPGRRKVVKVIYNNLGAAMPKNWVPPERRGGGKKGHLKTVGLKQGAGKQAAVAKGKALFAGKGKKIQTASVSDNGFRLTEGAGLAGRVIGVGRLAVKPLTEGK